MRKFLLCVAFCFVSVAACAQSRSSGVSQPDPFLLFDSYETGNPLGTTGPRPGYRDTNGLTLQIAPINPTKKTLVLIAAGQSNRASVNPTLYIPANSGVVDNFNIYNGAGYNIGGPLLGAEYDPDLGLGPGNVMARVADKFIGIFDRVILVPVAIGNTIIAQWDPATSGNCCANRISVALARLAARGITCATTGITCAIEWGQGENDNLNGTSQASYQASWGRLVADAQAHGFSGRIFIAIETLDAGVISPTIQAAQTAVVDNVTVFQSGNIDTLTGTTNRQPGLTHLNDVGAASGATLIFNAMVASGSPY